MINAPHSSNTPHNSLFHDFFFDIYNFNQQHILPPHSKTHDSNVTTVLHQLLNGEYNQIIAGTQSRLLIEYIHTVDVDFIPLINNKLQSLIVVNNQTDSITLELYILGVTYLLQYTVSNYCGPIVRSGPAAASIMNPLLQCDGEDIYTNGTDTDLLLLARCILFHPTIITHIKAISALHLTIYQLRCLWLQQQLHTTSIESLRIPLNQLTEQVQSILTSENYKSTQPELYCLIQLELSSIHLYYYRYNECSQCMLNAADSIQFTAELTGILGTRTKYQTNKISQLVVTTTSNNTTATITATDNNEYIHEIMPMDIDIDSDTLLNQVQLDTDNTQSSTNLTLLQKAILLSRIQYIQSTSPATHTTVQAELSAYIQAILNKHNNESRCYVFEVVGLYQRSLIERLDQHKQIRSIQQMESIVAQYTQYNTDHVSYQQHIQSRTRYIYCSTLQPVWSIKSMLAQCFSASGLHKSALDLYNDLCMYDRVIETMILLDRHTDAIQLIQQQLTSTINNQPLHPLLYCLLGDIYNNDDSIEYYMKSWNISNQRYPRAQRSLGRYYRIRHEYGDAIKSYELALSINPSLPLIWYEVGYCATQLKQYDLAVQSYTRCITLDSTYGDAWNNLGTTHVLLNNYKQGYIALQHAVQQKYDSYQTWYNYMICAMNCNQFQQVINSINHIIQYRPKQSRGTVNDIDKLIGNKTLIVLNNYICDHTGDTYLIQQYTDMLDYIVAQIGSNEIIDECYSDMYYNTKQYQKSFDHRIQQLNTATQHITTIHQCQHIVHLCNKLYGTLQQCNTTANIYTTKTLYNNIHSKFHKLQQHIECDNTIQQLNELIESVGSMSRNNIVNENQSDTAEPSPYLSMWK